MPVTICFVRLTAYRYQDGHSKKKKRKTATLTNTPEKKKRFGGYTRDCLLLEKGKRNKIKHWPTFSIKKEVNQTCYTKTANAEKHLSWAEKSEKEMPYFRVCVGHFKCSRKGEKLVQCTDCKCQCTRGLPKW